MNYELNKDKFKAGKEIKEIEDMIEAYEFAQHNRLNEQDLLNSVLNFIKFQTKNSKFR